jgi:glycosyltransferase involved in cell wall biosynthesis
MNKNSKITVILPAFNEEVSIKATIKSVKEFLPLAKIVVVDNGSDDLTAKLAVETDAEVVFEKRRGKGLAFRRGISKLSDDAAVVIMIDADDTYDFSRAQEAVQLLMSEGVGMVVGNRIPILETGRIPTFRNGHKWGNRLLSTTYRLLFKINIQDSLSGYRVMSRSFVETFTSVEPGFTLEAELNAHAYILDCGVQNIDVNYKGRSENSHSKLSTYKDGWKILRALLKMFRNERPSFAFNILGSLWLVAGAGLGLRSFKEYLETSRVLHFPSLIVGVGFLVIASLLWVTGMILERTKLFKHTLIQSDYRKISRCY